MSSSVRLSNYMRQNVINSIMAAGFDDRTAAIGQREIALGNKIGKHLYGAHWDTDLPEVFTLVRDRIHFYIAGEQHCLDCDSVRTPKQVPTYEDAFRKFFLLKDKALIEELRLFEKEKDAHFQLYRDTHKQASVVVHSCNTTKQLIAAWPEAEPFIPVVGRKSTQLAVRIDHLNANLGIK